MRRDPSENDYYRECPSADAMTDGGGAGEGDDLNSSSIEEIPRQHNKRKRSRSSKRHGD